MFLDNILALLAHIHVASNWNWKTFFWAQAFQHRKADANTSYNDRVMLHAVCNLFSLPASTEEKWGQYLLQLRRNVPEKIICERIRGNNSVCKNSKVMILARNILLWYGDHFSKVIFLKFNKAVWSFSPNKTFIILIHSQQKRPN